MRRGFSGVVRFGDEVQQLARALEKDDPDVAASARARLAWERAADERTLQHTVAVFAVPGKNLREVLVYVDSSIRAADMNMQSERFRMHLNIALAEMREQEGEDFLADLGGLFPMENGVEAVKKLKFIVSKKAYEPKERRKSTAELLAAADEAAKTECVEVPDATCEELRRAADSIDDARLRRVVLQAAQSNLSRAGGGEQAVQPKNSHAGAGDAQGDEKARERHRAKF